MRSTPPRDIIWSVISVSFELLARLIFCFSLILCRTSVGDLKTFWLPVLWRKRPLCLTASRCLLGYHTVGKESTLSNGLDLRGSNECLVIILGDNVGSARFCE